MKSQDRRRLGALLFSQLEPYIRRKCTGILSALVFVLFHFTLLPASFANHHLKVSWPCGLRLCQHKHDGRAFLPERRPNVYLRRSGEGRRYLRAAAPETFSGTLKHFPISLGGGSKGRGSTLDAVTGRRRVSLSATCGRGSRTIHWQNARLVVSPLKYITA